MSAYLTNFLSELRQHVATVWPEVIVPVPGGGELVRGVWQAEHVEAVPFERIQPPYAVIAVPEWSDSDWSPDKASHMAWVEFYYIGIAIGDPATVRTKLEALRDYLWPDPPVVDPLVLGQVMKMGRLTTSRSLPFNQAMRAKKLDTLAGQLRVQCLVEEPTL